MLRAPLLRPYGQKWGALVDQARSEHLRVLRDLRTFARAGECVLMRDIPGGNRLDVLRSRWDAAQQSLDDGQLSYADAQGIHGSRIAVATTIARDLARATAVIVAVGLAVFLAGEQITPIAAAIVAMMPGIVALGGMYVLRCQSLSLVTEGFRAREERGVVESRAHWLTRLHRMMVLLEARATGAVETFVPGPSTGTYRLLRRCTLNEITAPSEAEATLQRPLRIDLPNMIRVEKLVEKSRPQLPRRGLTRPSRVLAVSWTLLFIVGVTMWLLSYSFAFSNVSVENIFIAGFAGSIAHFVAYYFRRMDVESRRVAINRARIWNTQRVLFVDIDQRLRQLAEYVMDRFNAAMPIDITKGEDLRAKVIGVLNEQISAEEVIDLTTAEQLDRLLL